MARMEETGEENLENLVADLGLQGLHGALAQEVD